MNIDLLSAIIFFVILYSIFFIFKHKFEMQGWFAMYKTKLGLKLMNKISTKDNNTRMPFYGITTAVVGLILIVLAVYIHSLILGGFGLLFIIVGIIIALPLVWLGYFSSSISFLGMILIFYILVKGVVDIFVKSAVTPTVTPLLPGIQLAPGIPVLSFWHWIIGILIIATIHEFSHGIYARLNKVPVKSSGFAFLGPLLAAFVEPDEKVMSKKKKRNQLSILSAGPMSNIITGILFFIVGTMIISPIVFSSLQFQGLTINSLSNNSALNSTGIQAGDVITAIDNKQLENSSSIELLLLPHKSGDTINLTTLNKTHQVTLGKSELNSTRPALGIYASPYYGETPLNISIGLWFIELFFWLYVISLGVGLFNLLPLGPVDGGRMFYLVSLAVFKKEKRAKKAFKIMTWICIVLILLNLLPFIIKVFNFIIALL